MSRADVRPKVQAFAGSRIRPLLCRDGASDRTVGVPDGFDYEIHNRKDIEKLLGEKAWAISFKDSACRCFGYMASSYPLSQTVPARCQSFEALSKVRSRRLLKSFGRRAEASALIADCKRLQICVHHRRRLLRSQESYRRGHQCLGAAHQKSVDALHALLLQHSIRPLCPWRRLRTRLPLLNARGRTHSCISW